MAKKALAIMLVVLMLPVAACADKSAPLFPAYDEASGKWGYIDVNGQWAITPQFATADWFRGQYAVASTGDPWDDTAGVINTDGQWVVEPRYFFDEGYDEFFYGGMDTGFAQVWRNADRADSTGLFDVRSGFFSGLVYGSEIRFWSHDRVVPIDGDYYDRTSGELIIEIPEPYETDWINCDSDFHYGFACVFHTGDEEESDEEIANEGICMIDAEGHILDLGSLRFEPEDWACGLLRAEDPDVGIRGYFDPAAMDWRITGSTLPDGRNSRFLETQPFYAGYACVRLENGCYGHIDIQGNLMYVFDQGVITEPYQFYADYAWLKEPNVLIDPAGNVVLNIPDGWKPRVQQEDEYKEDGDYYASPGGIVELNKRIENGRYKTGLMKLDGTWLLDPEIYGRNWGESCALEPHRFFSEGLQSVVKVVGIREWKTVHNVKTGDYQEPVYETRVGYVNEQGEVVVDFFYDDGGAFINGLALVARDGLRGYVNARGEEVYFWNEPEEP